MMNNYVINLIKKIPILNLIVQFVYYKIVIPIKPFPGTEIYWQERYKEGGNSGTGSYKKLAKFKAEVLNSFVDDRNITSIIEYGCGDGNQLLLSKYPSYIGFDVSSEAVKLCTKIFAKDKTKTFKVMSDYSNETAQLTLSLDVIYHLIEDEVYFEYMKRLFNSSNNFVIIYSSNTEKQEAFQAAHIKHRKFSDWVKKYKPDWKLIQYIPNRYPYKGEYLRGSFADFYIYERHCFLKILDKNHNF